MRVPAALLASWRHGWRALAVLLLCAVAALAQAQSADDSDAAPPDRVARLSDIAGDLGFLPAGSQDWASADLNRPLTTGDRLSTGDGARAELELGGGVLRMAGGTDFGLLNLNDNLAQVELTRGTLNLSVRHLDQGQSYEIDTPTLALVVNHPGTFRVDVDNGGNGTRVTVLAGQASVYGENNAQHDVFQGRSYQFDDASLGALMVTDIGGGDAFDAWCSDRDQRYAQSQTRRYVSDDVVGYQDLDQYGSWQNSPDYGAVWYPSQVAAGWAPYRDGHWAYIAPWGWTWVDDSPWGFAPYHYGRWAYIRGAWGWIPGPVVARPVYAPALVAFVGGGGWSVSIGIGGAPVGWFPLGPGEVYNPWYRCGRDYYRRVNVTNIYVHNTYNRTTIINNINNQYNDYREGRAPRNLRYANREAPRGFTAMPGKAFAGGQRVQRDQLRVDPRQLVAAPVLAHGVTALQPTTRSVAPPRNFRGNALPTADFRRNVVARTPPPATLPMVRPAALHASEPAARLERAPFANVRVLNERGAPRQPDTARNEAGRNEPAQPRLQVGADRTSPLHAGLPRTSNIPAELPIVRKAEPEPTPAGALPSARYAHPGASERTLPTVEPIRRAEPNRVQQAPRPGVSYIAGPEQPHPQPNERSERPANTLPQPPRFERAPQAAAPLERAPAPAYVQPHEQPYQPPRVESMRQPTPPRYERADNPPRPAYQPPREEPMRQAEPRFERPANQPPREYPRPSYQPQPRFEQPQPHYEAPRPAAQPQQQHAEPPHRAPPPKYKDEQQH